MNQNVNGFDRAALMAMFKPKVVPITVQVGDDVMHLFVKELSAAEVFELQELQKEKGADGKMFAIRLVSKTLCMEDGQPALTLEEAKELTQLKIQAFNKMAEAIAMAVGLVPPKEEAGKA